MIERFAEKHKEATVAIVRSLCNIPAPSFGERKRAEFCKQWLEDAGAEGVYIDSVNNVIYPLCCDASDEITVVAAHTDTVFPDTACYPEYREDDDCIHCPGAGDDSSGVAVLLMTAKYFMDNKITPRGGILFVCNSCEEGLGNLVGVRQLTKDYAGRIKRFITYDAFIGKVTTVAAGSHRYEVTVTTEGGHSYQKFGKANAIAVLSGIVNDIYSIEVPQKAGVRTTYNVGMIEGGTSINTIAQSASMLCEYRSNDRECLSTMQDAFERIFAAAQSKDVSVTVKRIGDRPCKGEVDLSVEAEMVQAYAKAVKEIVGIDAEDQIASTDANIPMSQGIAAICVGTFESYGSHTREEYTVKEGLTKGLKISLKMLTALTIA